MIAEATGVHVFIHFFRIAPFSTAFLVHTDSTSQQSNYRYTRCPIFTYFLRIGLSMFTVVVPFVK